MLPLLSFPFLLTSLKQMADENMLPSSIITSCSIRYYGLVVIIEMLGGESFPKRLAGGRGRFVEREGWEATAVPAVTYSVTGTNNACTTRVTRWFVFELKRKVAAG